MGLMERAINDITLIRQLIGMGTRLLFVLGFSGIIAFLFMFYQSPSLTLVLLPALPVFAVIGWIIPLLLFSLFSFFLFDYFFVRLFSCLYVFCSYAWFHA